MLYLEQFDGEKWNALSYSDFYIGGTGEESYQSIEAALVEINAFLENKYGKGVPAPESGFELVQWIIDNKLSLGEDNKLSIKQ